MGATHDVLVTGGTGMLGAKVVGELCARKHHVGVLSRKASPEVPEGVTAVTGDLLVGTGLRSALAGVDTVVHCATNPRRHREVDLDGTRALVSAAADVATPPHLVYISIVGCDRIPYPYFRSKAMAELAIAESGLPWTVFRTTQFHDWFFSMVYGMTRLPVVPVPRGVQGQPVDVAEVAGRIAELVELGPSGRVDDMGGPEVLPLDEAVRVVQRATGRERRIVSVPAVGRTVAGFRAGHHLAPDYRQGRRSFADYVEDHVHRAGDAVRVDVPYKWRQ